MALFLDALKHKGLLDDVAVVLAAVGSRKLDADDDFATQAWRSFLPRLTIYGFEADASACETANVEVARRGGNWTERHFSAALGAQRGAATLHVTRNPMCSSLLPPNEPLLRRFIGLHELAGPDRQESISLTTLDEYAAVASLRDVDFLKIDVQGAELDVLCGAKAMLARSVVAVQVEVEFAEIYRGQPLFAEVDAFLRGAGFTLFDLQLVRRKRATRACLSGDYLQQVLWGDAVYLRDLAADDAAVDAARKFKTACIADALGLSDHALELFEQLGGDALGEVIAQATTARAAETARPAAPLANLGAGRNAAARTPEDVFLSAKYQEHNRARQAHLASLGLPLAKRRVLELGAGIGCHTPFFLERDCRVVVTEARPENLRVLRQRLPGQDARRLDLDAPPPQGYGPFEVVYCYGLLYHLSRPAAAIAWMAGHCSDLLLLETCVSIGADGAQSPCAEDAQCVSQAISGTGCRPTRRWVVDRLQESFAHVYLPATQPDHEEFPLDWTAPRPPGLLTRAVFIASRRPIRSAMLGTEIPMQQVRFRAAGA